MSCALDPLPLEAVAWSYDNAPGMYWFVSISFPFYYIVLFFFCMLYLLAQKDRTLRKYAALQVIVLVATGSFIRAVGYILDAIKLERTFAMSFFRRLGGVVWFMQFAITVLFWMELLTNVSRKNMHNLVKLQPVFWMLTLMYAVCVAGYEAFARLVCGNGELSHGVAVLRTCTKGLVLAIYVGLFLISAYWTHKFHSRLKSLFRSQKTLKRIRRFKLYLKLLAFFTVIWFIASTLDSWDPKNPIITIELSPGGKYALTVLEYICEAIVIFLFFAMQVPAELINSVFSCKICKTKGKVKWDRIESKRRISIPNRVTVPTGTGTADADQSMVAAIPEKLAKIPLPSGEENVPIPGLTLRKVSTVMRHAGFDVQASIFEIGNAVSQRHASFGEVEANLSVAQKASSGETSTKKPPTKVHSYA